LALIDIFVKMIPTAVFGLGGIWLLSDGLNTNSEGKILAGILLIGIAAFLQYYYLKRRYK
jgi:hypothetical protein